MKPSLLLLLLLFPLWLEAQDFSLTTFSEQSLQYNRTGMLILGTWAISNIGLAATQLPRRQGEVFYFHQMNLAWNVANLGLAGISFLQASQGAEHTLAEVLGSQHFNEKVFLVNAALDLAYISTGFYLKERGKSSALHADRLKGYGKAVILQGSFLLLFDGIMYGLHHVHGAQLNRWLENAQIGLNHVSYSFYF